MYLSLQEVIVFLKESSEKKIKPRELLELCKAKSMRQTVYRNYFEDVKFDNGFSLVFQTSSSDEVILEIIEDEEDVYQAGIRIIYHSPVSDEKLADDFNDIYTILMNQYRSAEDTSYEDEESFLFCNDKTYCKLSKFEYDELDVITITLTNIEIWEKYN